VLKINRENLRSSHEAPWFLLDLVMLALLVLNFAFLLFDGLYETAWIFDALSVYAPQFVAFYDPIHHNFLFIDLAFIGIFFSEFCFRWYVSIQRKEHVRWYFFPFLHWYDIIGMIPLGATRLFRFLRIVSILHRLHKHRIIDLNQTALFRFVAFYADVLVEELSDRIVVKVLSDAQKDISAGSPLMDDIVNQVLAPRRPVVNAWLTEVLRQLGASIKDAELGEAIRHHVQQSVGKAVRQNAQVSTLQWLPVVGSRLEQTLEQAVTDIVVQSLVNLLCDLDSEKIDAMVDTGIRHFSVPEGTLLDHEVLSLVNECLELVKAHISQQRWKTQLEQRAPSTPI